MKGSILGAWATVRYARLLPLVKQSRERGRRYARVAGAVEFALSSTRRRVAANRIQRWLGVPHSTASRVFRASLESEAREEADTVYYMNNESIMRTCFRTSAAASSFGSPVLYLTLHLGSPVLTYLYLASRDGMSIQAIARPLDASNPMARAKRRYAVAKVAWVERMSRRRFLYTSEDGALDAFATLKHGASLYAAADVPADVVRRSGVACLFGEPVRIATGIVTMAHLARVPIRPVVGVSSDEGITVHTLQEITAPTEQSLQQAALAALAGFIERYPHEWWLWPYLPSADDSYQGGR